MGSFRSQPDLTKHSIEKKGNNLSFAASHMCGTFNPHTGWRIYMEDAHISVSPLSDKKNSIFGVFDGHGGTSFYTQDLRFQPMLNDISLKNLRKMSVIRRDSTTKH